MLYGREAERARLRAALDAAHRGRGGAIVVRGEPGIGKTALMRDVREGATGFRVLTARGIESESGLAFAGLSDLLRPVVDRIDALPGAQRTALRAALALGPPGVPDRFAAYTATLGLLGALARDGPVLILVDDGHWLDLPSQEALLFCARRLGEDPVLIVATSREVAAEDLDLTGIEEIRLGPLDDTAARDVLRTADGVLQGAVTEAVLAAADGNPLALVDLPRGLSDAERAGRAALPRHLRAGEALAHRYRGRLERIGPGPRRAALLAAVSEDEAIAPVVAALEAGGGSAADLAAAERAGLVTLSPGTARMRHPLLRSVVLEHAGPDELRAAHRALADRLDPDHAAEQRAWHLAEAALGPDEEAVAALEGAAAIAAGRTGYAAAAAALERAAALTADPAGAAGRRLRAAEFAAAAGRPRWALSLIGDDTAGRPEAAHLAGLLAMWTGDLQSASRLLVTEGGRAAATDPRRAAAMLADGVLTRAIAGECEVALQIARRAYALSGGQPLPTVTGYLAGALVLRGHARLARPLLQRFDSLTAEVDPTSPTGPLLVLSASWRAWIGDDAPTMARLDEWIEHGRAAAAVGFVGFVLAFACEIDHRLGRWGLARSRGEEAIELLTETGQHGPVGHAMCALARVEAGMGLPGARARARAGREAGLRLGIGSDEAYARGALGFAELSDGDPAGAVAELAPLEGITERQGLAEPAVIPWQPDLLEAHAHLGRLGEARRVLATLSERAHRTGGLWARAATHRGRGLIDDDIDRHFGEALALHARTRMPFERARTELAYGTRLRRAGRRTQAREQLERALATFEELGARPWARQASGEIAASGAARPRRDAARPDDLSPRELQVALTVAEGATNREAAARLFLSEKTIERHLGSVYRKLGLRSRSELARRFAREGLGTGGPSPETRRLPPGAQ